MKFWVPGRIEFLGKHTDYAGGRSLLCSMERGIRFTAQPRRDAIVRVRDARSGETVECPIGAIVARPAGWATYPTAVVRRVARDFPDARVGVDIDFESDLPRAAGMSSSSALVVGVFMAFAAANDLTEHPGYRSNVRSPEDLAEYLGSIERGAAFRSFAGDEGVGTLSGCEDQTAMVCGRAGELVRYSFCPVRFEAACPLPPGHTFVVAASGVVAEKTASALEKYNALSRRAAAAAEAWRKASGRIDATLGDAVASSGAAAVREAMARSTPDASLASELLGRFEQFHLESEIIIPAASGALSRGDLAELGTLVDRSQAAVERLLGNQIPETIALARSARELGAVAASAFGAGFGGSVWALVAEANGPTLLENWRQGYLERFPQHRDAARFFMTRAGPPAGRLSS